MSRDLGGRVYMVLGLLILDLGLCGLGLLVLGLCRVYMVLGLFFWGLGFLVLGLGFRFGIFAANPQHTVRTRSWPAREG